MIEECCQKVYNGVYKRLDGGITMRPTYVEIDTSRARENLRRIKQSLPEGRTSTAVVKANAYGHGSVQIASIAIEEGYEALAVAFPEEAVPLREAGIDVPIYLLGITRPQSFPLIMEVEAISAVCESTDFEALNGCAKAFGKIAECVVAVDTGMHRIGIKPEEAVSFLESLDKYPYIKVTGFFSHMANADAADQTHAEGQIAAFRKMVDQIQAARPGNYRFSLANSAGLLAIPDSLLTDARPGIIQYGIMPSLDVPNTLGLKPILSFHSEVVHVQHLDKGEAVGYGSTFVTTRPTTIATIPVGYADGLPRVLSNKGSVLIHGKRCQIVGRVCMDQVMVAMPEGVESQPGDKVVLIGRQGHESITALEMATLANTIPYEILCGIAERVPRHYK